MEGWCLDMDADKMLQEKLDEVFGAHRLPGPAAVVTKGHARDVLLAASRTAEMLVVGSAARSSWCTRATRGPDRPTPRRPALRGAAPG